MNNQFHLPTTVLFGTSMTRDIVGRRLGHKERTVINISQSGASIKSTFEMVNNFKKFDNSAKFVDQGQKWTQT